MGDSFYIDLDKTRAAVTTLRQIGATASAIDIEAPLKAAGAALPGSQSATAASEAAFEMSAATAIWADAMTSVSSSVAESATAYEQSDTAQSRAMRTAGAPQ